MSLGAMGETTLKFMEKMHKEWMNRGNQKIRGKIKTVSSIGRVFDIHGHLIALEKTSANPSEGRKQKPC